MATWYQVERYTDKIETLDVVRETDKCLFVRGRWLSNPGRETRMNKTPNMFPDWVSARNRLIDRTKGEVKHYGREYATAKERLDKLIKQFGDTQP